MCHLINNPVNSCELDSVTLLKDDLSQRASMCKGTCLKSHTRLSWRSPRLKLSIFSLCPRWSPCLEFSSASFWPWLAPSFLQAQFRRNLLRGQPLGPSWLCDAMVESGMAFSIIWHSFSFSFSLVCVFILHNSLFLPSSHPHPSIWTLWEQGSFLSCLL